MTYRVVNYCRNVGMHIVDYDNSALAELAFNAEKSKHCNDLVELIDLEENTTIDWVAPK